MLTIAERERAYRKRAASSAALAAVLQLAAWWFLPSPLGPAHRLPAGPDEGFGLFLYEIAEVGGAPAGGAAAGGAAGPAPAEAVAPDGEPVPEPELALESSPETAAESAPEDQAQDLAAEAEPPAPAAGSSAEGAEVTLGDGGVAGRGPGGADGTSGSGSEAGSAAGGAGSGGGSGGAGSTLGVPRIYVQPQVPIRLLVQRKIDDFVVLQVLVAADGRVRDVRVQREIPNCAECTQSAVEAARQNVYNPPVVPPDSAGVWSSPISMRFTYRR